MTSTEIREEYRDYKVLPPLLPHITIAAVIANAEVLIAS